MAINKKRIQNRLKQTALNVGKAAGARESNIRRSGALFSTRTAPAELDSAMRAGMFTVRDRGPGSIIIVENNARAFCEVITSGAESRALEQGKNFAIGQELSVVLKTAGPLTITGSDDGSLVLTDAGDIAIFRVSQSGLNRSDRIWKTIFPTSGSSTPSDDSFEIQFASTTLIGEVVYILSDGRAQLANASALSTARAAALSLEDVLAGGIGTIITDGRVERADWTPVLGTALLTPGTTYYLATSDGNITSSAPITAGQVVIGIGKALSATELDIEIQQPVLL